MRIHLFLFDEFLPVGVRDAFAHGGAKTSVLFKQAQGGILRQPLGIRTGMTGLVPRSSFAWAGFSIVPGAFVIDN
jgi:hypothetical protein